MTPYEWFVQFLGLINAPPSDANTAVCAEWARMEGMNISGGLRFTEGYNPWMTTWPDGPDTRRSSRDIGFGRGKWNNANPPNGVGMYATPEDGLEATRRTLMGHAGYEPILRAFRAQRWNDGLTAAWETWIGSPGYARSLSNFAQDQWTATEEQVTRTEYEDLVLAVFAGGEEHAETAPYAVRPREERLAAAMERMRLRAAGQERSVADIAASAAAPAMVPAHRHEMQIAVARTGGVER